VRAHRCDGDWFDACRAHRRPCPSIMTRHPRNGYAGQMVRHKFAAERRRAAGARCVPAISGNKDQATSARVKRILPDALHVLLPSRQGHQLRRGSS
jgi:hypothetical protein